MEKREVAGNGGSDDLMFLNSHANDRERWLKKS
jgi:hypothetical protein